METLHVESRTIERRVRLDDSWILSGRLWTIARDWIETSHVILTGRTTSFLECTLLTLLAATIFSKRRSSRLLKNVFETIVATGTIRPNTQKVLRKKTPRDACIQNLRQNTDKTDISVECKTLCEPKPQNTTPPFVKNQSSFFQKTCVRW